MYKDTDPQETREWIESIEDALEEHGYERTRFLLEKLIDYAQTKGARLPFNTSTPYVTRFYQARSQVTLATERLNEK